VPDQKSKDQALNQQDTGGCKILLQNPPPGLSHRDPWRAALDRDRSDTENDETIKAY
jgi:hypothetical protein